MTMETKVKLADAPGGPELIASLAQVIRDLSLGYAGTPDDRAEASLQRYVASVMPDLSKAVGASTAAEMVRAFTRTVMTEKRRIEAGGASRA